MGASSALSFRFDLRSVRLVQRETLQANDLFAQAPPTGGSTYGGQGQTASGKKVLGELSDDLLKRSIAEEGARKEAEKKLRQVLSKVDEGISVPSKLDRFLLQDGAKLLINEYVTNGGRSLKDMKRRVEKHLLPYFGATRGMTSFTTDSILSFQSIGKSRVPRMARSTGRPTT